jgi:hypothetical protein
MGIKDLFRKKEDNVIDLSDMQKRGIFKPRPEKRVDVIDLSTTPSPATQTIDDASPLGFLGSFASSTNNGIKTETAEIEPSSIVLDTGKKQKLKGILRDLKVQANQNSDKVYKLVQRIDLLEKKLDRIERRVGI